MDAGTGRRATGFLSSRPEDVVMPFRDAAGPVRPPPMRDALGRFKAAGDRGRFIERSQRPLLQRPPPARIRRFLAWIAAGCRRCAAGLRRFADELDPPAYRPPRKRFPPPSRRAGAGPGI
jgi:hypothetical protein